MNIKQQYLKMGKNFMTPKIIRYEQFDYRILELSSGIDFNDKKIYGVSEFEKSEHPSLYGLQTTQRGKMFYDRKEAEKYYALLKYI